MLRTMSDPTKPHEDPGGAGLAREIERKYLLAAMPERARAGTAIRMQQGYIPGTSIHERIRREESDAGVRLRRTIKLGRGIERIEVEESISDELFAGLYALTVGARVEKTRYVVVDGDHAWEIDEFTDRDLVLAEIELPTADAIVTFPEWLAPHVVREVTDEPAYLNLKLAR
jgi:adenylate cyclase